MFLKFVVSLSVLYINVYLCSVALNVTNDFLSIEY